MKQLCGAHGRMERRGLCDGQRRVKVLLWCTICGFCSSRLRQHCLCSNGTRAQAGMADMTRCSECETRRLPLYDSICDGGDGVQIWRPSVQEMEQAGVVCRGQQKGIQHHAVGCLSQAWILCGDVWRKHCQLAPLGEEVHPALPCMRIVLRPASG